MNLKYRIDNRGNIYQHSPPDMSLKSNNIQTVSFLKMQGAGNDFIVLDNRNSGYTKEQVIEWAPQLCNRKFGIGSDGILALQPTEEERLDYTMLYRNPDGSDAGMCGNGARCLALYAHKLGMGDTLRFNVHENVYLAKITGDNRVCIHFPTETRIQEQAVDGITLYKLQTGTEHVVVPLDKEITLDNEKKLRTRGRELRNHRLFEPKGTNINFIYGNNIHEVQIQTYERGVEDLTLACGTGAMAGALVWHYLSEPLSETTQRTVVAKGGTLTVYFHYDSTRNMYTNLKLEGPAHFVFEGSYFL